MRERRRDPLLLSTLALAAAALTAAPAQADDNLLHGPHPFLKENAVSVHALIAEGHGDALSGAKLEVDYDYKLTGSSVAPLWLNLLLSFQNSGCTPAPANSSLCDDVTGDLVETMAGAKWKFATPLPIVPYLRADAGFAFAFPKGATDASGVALRVAAGANYFFFDWLGMGAQLGFSVGHIEYDSTFSGSHSYALVDFGGGLELQF